MASGGFDISQLIEFRNNFAKLEHDLPHFLEEFVLKMSYRAMRQTKKLTPVDTGDLRNKWEVTDVKVHKHYVEASIVNPQEYASFVEDGHWQRRRWLPGEFTGNKFVYNTDSDEGIMLREKWIPGHYMARVSLNKINDEIPKRFEREFKRWVQLKLGD